MARPHPEMLLFSEKMESEPKTGLHSHLCHACSLALLPRPRGLLDFLFRSILATVALDPNISKSVSVTVHVLFSAFRFSACHSWARGLRFGFVDGPLFDF